MAKTISDAATAARKQRAAAVNSLTKLIERLYRLECDALRLACNTSMGDDYRTQMRGYADGLAAARELLIDLRASGHRILDSTGVTR